MTIYCECGFYGNNTVNGYFLLSSKTAAIQDSFEYRFGLRRNARFNPGKYKHYPAKTGGKYEKISTDVSNLSQLLNRSAAECKRKNTSWSGINYAVKTENDSLLCKDKTTLQKKIQGDNVVDIFHRGIPPYISHIGVCHPKG